MGLFGLKYKLLVILPQKNFDDAEYHEILRACKESKIISTIASNTLSYPALGIHGEKVKPKLNILDAEMEEYHGIVYLGGLGAREYFNDINCHKLARKAVELERIIGAIDLAPVILAHAEILRGKRATVHATEESHLIAGGADYKNEPLVVDGCIITAQDTNLAKEFADTVIGGILRMSDLT